MAFDPETGVREKCSEETSDNGEAAAAEGGKDESGAAAGASTLAKVAKKTKLKKHVVKAQVEDDSEESGRSVLIRIAEGRASIEWD